ncbi:hypothetical protein FSARC_12837 [Fusarium sarcochroum]|uniref:DUF7702 domain-containing protein n=1 Tax=Fusarium sarcochroum TaxID=1208366 RepID=A0A8H4T5P5_9HYPO|nr:hypothetical protein FSARC_12837 [Fusarium sarcochroum]
MTALTTAELAIYAVLVLPTLFILYKHGKPGIFGWVYLFVFCTLRIIGGAMFLSKSSSAVTVSNIGLSPLLLSAAGVLHEAQYYREKPTRAEKVKIVLFHVLVGAGVALLAVGLSGLQSTSPTPDDQKKVKIGLGILTASWGLLVIQALRTTFYNPTGRRDSPFITHLLIAVIITLVFVGIRVIYTLIALTSNDADLNPITGTLAIRVVLSFLPELIAALILLAAGLLTRNIRSLAQKERKPSNDLEVIA